MRMGGSRGGTRMAALGKKAGTKSANIGGIRTNFVQKIAPPKLGGKGKK